MKKTSDLSLLAWIRRFFILLVIFTISIGPSMQLNVENKALSDLSMIFVVDNSGSMSAKTGETVDDPSDNSNGSLDNQDADDFKAESSATSKKVMTRLDQVKKDLYTILDSTPPSKYSIIEFNSVADLVLPLTSNARTAKSFVSSISPELTSSSNGTSLDVASDKILAQINNIKQNYPHDRIALYYFSDGDTTSSSKDVILDSYSNLRGIVNEGAVIGYGDKTPAEMYEYNPDLSGLKSTLSSLDLDIPVLVSYTDSLILDPVTKQPALSAINEDNLRIIGDNIGLRYLKRNSSDDIKTMADGLYAKYWVFAQNFEKRTSIQLIVWPFYIALSILVLWEFFAYVNSRVGNTRKLGG